MTHTITVPDYIREPADAALYIRKELIARGIDPNSVYPMDGDEGDKTVLTAPRTEPFMIEMSFSYDRDWGKKFKQKKPVTMSYQQGFHSSGG